MSIEPRDVGRIKKGLLTEVIAHPESNTRERLLKLVPSHAVQRKKERER